MTRLRLEAIRSRRVDIPSLTIASGDFAVLVGPTGAGKSTLLNIIAGFENHQGRIFFDDQSVEGIPSHQRRIGYLFQDLYLFPHLTARQNLKIALRGRRRCHPAEAFSLDRVVDMFRLQPLLSKYPRQLSGGEKQRVAIARTLAAGPRLLLLDEPFSHLDFRAARHLRYEFKQLRYRLNITTLFVTHNLREAQALGNQLVVMEKGRITRTGRMDDLWLESPPAGGFLEQPNILEGSIEQPLANGLVSFRWNRENLLVAGEGQDFRRVTIWPGDVHLTLEKPSGSSVNCYQGVIVHREYTDSTVTLQVSVNDDIIQATVAADDPQVRFYSENKAVYVILRLWCLRAESNRHRRTSR